MIETRSNSLNAMYEEALKVDRNIPSGPNKKREMDKILNRAASSGKTTIKESPIFEYNNPYVPYPSVRDPRLSQILNRKKEIVQGSSPPAVLSLPVKQKLKQEKEEKRKTEEKHASSVDASQSALNEEEQHTAEQMWAKRCSPGEFTLTPNQHLLKNLMSPLTPYNGLMLFHGVGVGKTCAAVTIAERFPDRKVIVISPLNKASFLSHVFDESKLRLKEDSGEIDLQHAAHQCTGSTYLNQLSAVDLYDLQKVKARIASLIAKRYTVMTFYEFAKMVRDLSGEQGGEAKTTATPATTKGDRRISEHFRNHVIVVDEAHRLREKDLERESPPSHPSFPSSSFVSPSSHITNQSSSSTTKERTRHHHELPPPFVLQKKKGKKEGQKGGGGYDFYEEEGEEEEEEEDYDEEDGWNVEANVEANAEEEEEEEDGDTRTYLSSRSNVLQDSPRKEESRGDNKGEIDNNKKEDGGGKAVTEALRRVLTVTDRVKLLLLTATPMFNVTVDLLDLLNLLLINDKRPPLEKADVFDASDRLTRAGKDRLLEATRGYVSYMRGDDPFAFPSRFTPLVNDDPQCILLSHAISITKDMDIKAGERNVDEDKSHNDNSNGKMNTTKRTNKATAIRKKQKKVGNNHHGGAVGDSLEEEEEEEEYDKDTVLTASPMTDYQMAVYNIFGSVEREQEEDIGDEEEEGGRGALARDNKKKTMSSSLSGNTESDKFAVSNITFPLSEEAMIQAEGESINPKVFAGEIGFKRCFIQNPGRALTFSYAPMRPSGKPFPFLAPQYIGRYAPKLKTIVDRILSSEGVVFVYSRFLSGGLFPLSMALEHFGFSRYGKTPNLLSMNSLSSSFSSSANAQQSKHQEQQVQQTVRQKGWTYIALTGRKDDFSLAFEEELAAATSPANVNGDVVKVVLASQKAGEGINMRYIREVHIMEPWFHFNRVEQAVGRAARNCSSHKDLPMEKRNVTVHLHASVPPSVFEGARRMLAEKEAARSNPPGLLTPAFPLPSGSGSNAVAGSKKKKEKEQKRLEQHDSIDLKTYRRAQLKQRRIRVVEKLLMDNALDCSANYHALYYDPRELGMSVRMVTSQGKVLDAYPLGDHTGEDPRFPGRRDRPSCSPLPPLSSSSWIDDSTYQAEMHAPGIESCRRAIAQAYSTSPDALLAFTFHELLDVCRRASHRPSSVSIDSVVVALRSMLEDRAPVHDVDGRQGHLIFASDKYIFQPRGAFDDREPVRRRGSPRRHHHLAPSSAVPTKRLLFVPKTMKEKRMEESRLRTGSKRTGKTVLFKVVQRTVNTFSQAFKEVSGEAREARRRSYRDVLLDYEIDRLDRVEMLRLLKLALAILNEDKRSGSVSSPSASSLLKLSRVGGYNARDVLRSLTDGRVLLGYDAASASPGKDAVFYDYFAHAYMRTKTSSNPRPSSNTHALALDANGETYAEANDNNNRNKVVGGNVGGEAKKGTNTYVEDKKKTNKKEEEEEGKENDDSSASFFLRQTIEHIEFDEVRGMALQRVRSSDPAVEDLRLLNARFEDISGYLLPPSSSRSEFFKMMGDTKGSSGFACHQTSTVKVDFLASRIHEIENHHRKSSSSTDNRSSSSSSTLERKLDKKSLCVRYELVLRLHRPESFVRPSVASRLFMGQQAKLRKK